MAYPYETWIAPSRFTDGESLRPQLPPWSCAIDQMQPGRRRRRIGFGALETPAEQLLDVEFSSHLFSILAVRSRESPRCNLISRTASRTQLEIVCSVLS